MILRYGVYIKDYINSDSVGIVVRLRELEEEGEPLTFDSMKSAKEGLAKYHIKYVGTPQTIENSEVLIIPYYSF